MDRPLRVAVIGAGAMGQRHLNGWQQVPGVQVVALADVNSELAARAAAERNIPVAVSDYRQAIDRPEVDAISVCTPACFHPAVTIFAAQAGKHVLCEKPVALSLAEADAMIAAAEAHGVQLVIGFMTRMAKGLPIVQRLIGPEGIGRPVLYRAHQLARVRPKLMMHELHGNGGPIVDTCCHNFDVWSLLFGAPRRVYARGWVWGEGKPSLAPIKEYAIDTAAMLIEYEQGDVADMTISWGMPEAFGRHGADEEELLGPNGVLRGDFRRELRYIDGDGQETVYGNRAAAMYDDEIATFARRLRGDGTGGLADGVTAVTQPITDDAAAALPLAGGADGRRALAMSLAVLDSIRTGQVIELAEGNG